MPIKVAFQNINGKKFKQVLPGKGLLDRLLPIGDARFPMLRWVDPNSSTIFNSNQMYPLLEELGRLVKEADTQENQELLQGIRELAIQCRDSPQTYLAFVGD